MIGAIIIVGTITLILVFRKTTRDSRELSRVPRVLIITSGKDGTGTLPEGVIITMESFIRQGAYTRVDTRDALLNKEYLAQFDILLLLTAIQYHDADRQYSLTFMEDDELEILNRWVETGGVLIAGDNIGRNFRNGTDRISMYGRLEPDNWPLSGCFGVMMSERNMEGFALKGDIADTLRGELIPPLAPGTWILVPDSILGKNTTILASWDNDTVSYPALTMNHYGKGTAFLLPSSYLLHPSNEGGHWNAMQIDAFCQVVLDEYYHRLPFRIGFSPWPDGHPAAFAVSLNSDGNVKAYERVFRLLKKKSISPTLFVNANLDDEIKSILHNYPHQLQSNGWIKTNMQNLTFSETTFQVDMNEHHWGKHFTGFRFPYTLNSVWGMDYLNRRHYIYESSIGIDHTQTFHGSLFPYHLPVFQGENYHVLDLVEVGPVARDDYYYFRMIQEDQIIDPVTLYEKSQLFNEYLRLFWTENTLARGAMMVYLGHPLFTGYNDTTILPLLQLIDTVRRDGAWITTMEEIASRWRIIDGLTLEVRSDKAKTKGNWEVVVRMPERQVLKGATLRLDRKPFNVSADQGSVKVRARNDHWLIIFDATDGRKIRFST